jgi:hypothetical protein
MVYRNYSLKRYNKLGRDISDLPVLWSDEDCWICVTQYSHPSITSGLHTNGPALIFIRAIEGKWIHSQEGSLRRTLDLWVDMGIGWFELLEEENGSRRPD